MTKFHFQKSLWLHGVGGGAGGVGGWLRVGQHGSRSSMAVCLETC